jgi:hypothetical protein
MPPAGGDRAEGILHDVTQRSRGAILPLGRSRRPRLFTNLHNLLWFQIILKKIAGQLNGSQGALSDLSGRMRIEDTDRCCSNDGSGSSAAGVGGNQWTKISLPPAFPLNQKLIDSIQRWGPSRRPLALGVRWSGMPDHLLAPVICAPCLGDGDHKRSRKAIARPTPQHCLRAIRCWSLGFSTEASVETCGRIMAKATTSRGAIPIVPTQSPFDRPAVPPSLSPVGAPSSSPSRVLPKPQQERDIGRMKSTGGRQRAR